MIDVSVVIPTYNRLWCLPKAIASCRGTTCATEIIVVDDGSTDGTWEWLEKQPDIKALRQPNQGQTYAVNAGTAVAAGKYIRFLDSDDHLVGDTIDLQFRAAEDHQAGLVYGRVDLYDHERSMVSKTYDLSPWTDLLEVQLGNGYGSHFLGMLFRADLVELTPRRPDLAFREDRMFLLEYALHEPKIVMTPGCAGYWVQHKGQMQANYSGLKAQVTNWQHLNIYERILAELERTGRLTARRKQAACRVLWPLAHWIAKDHLTEAKQVVDWIFELDPGFVPEEPFLLGLLYRKLGFTATEKLLKLRRDLLFRRWTINP